MSVSKNSRITEAECALEQALKMVHMAMAVPGCVPVSMMTRVQDAAIQATQAAQQLNQLVGILQSELEK